jgi:hypothetical protein
MGNAMSEEEENELLEEAYSMSLESPEADKVLNQGTSAPNCQPKHTTATTNANTAAAAAAAAAAGEAKEDQGQEVVMKGEDGPGAEADGKSHAALNAKHRRGSSVSDEEDRRKRQHVNGQKLSVQQQKKLGYFQMAKMGYQELVNAIIRPPRADYKVRTVLYCTVRIYVSMYGFMYSILFHTVSSCNIVAHTHFDFVTIL